MFRPSCSALALGEHLNEICQAVSRPGLFRIPHCHTSPLAPNANQRQDANVPTWNSSLCSSWQFGEIRSLEPTVPPKVNHQGSVAINCSGLTVIRLRRPFAGPFSFLGFASCNFYQVFAVIPRQVKTDSAEEGPHFPSYSKAAEFPMAWKKPAGIPGIRFLLTVKYVHFIIFTCSICTGHGSGVSCHKAELHTVTDVLL